MSEAYTAWSLLRAELARLPLTHGAKYDGRGFILHMDGAKTGFGGGLYQRSDDGKCLLPVS